MGRTRKQTVPGGADGRAGDGDDADLLFYLRTKYTLLGKAEWWWLMDESLAEISRRLETEHFVVIDGFLSRDAVSDLRDEIRSADDAGHLAPGVLAGGKAGDATQYTMRDVRGDRVGWFSGAETDLGLRWSRLPEAMKRADTLVNELGGLGGEARHVASRSKAMCTVYPGEGARYVRHVDNPDANGRLLTALIYLNPEWEEGDGGELRVFRCLRDAAAAAAAGFVDCDGRSLARADEYDVIVKKNEGAAPSEDATLVAAGPRDVAEGVRDVVTLGPAEENSADGRLAASAVRLTDVAPIGGRLVLFKSNARVPHEVLESRAPRYAVTLWYFHGEEVREARRRDAATEEQRAAQEAKIAREIATMSLKYGGESEVRVRRSGRDEWRDVEASPSASAASEFGVRRASGSNASTPKSAASNASSPFPPFVPPPCESTWDGVGRDRALVVRVPLPAGTKAGSCAAETEAGSRLVLSAPGVPDGTVVVHLPEGADANDVEVRLVKRPERALTVRVACPVARADLGEPEAGLGEPEADPEAEADAESAPTRAASRDASPRARGRGVRGRGRHALLVRRHRVHASPAPTPASSRCRAARRRPPRRRRLGRFHAGALVAGGNRRRATGAHPARPGRPQFPRHARVGAAVGNHARRASSRARRRRDRGSRARVLAAVAAAAGAKSGTDVGDGDPAAVPTTVIIAGASAKTEQFISEHTAYWRETIVAAPQPRGGVHLAFVGPDARDAAIRRLARRSRRRRDARRRGRTSRGCRTRLPSFLSGSTRVWAVAVASWRAGGRRIWCARCLDRTRPRRSPPRTITPIFEGNSRRFARWVRGSRSNRARIRFERTRTPSGRGTVPRGFASGRVTRRRGERWSCANAFRYVVRGFADGRGPSAGLTDAQLCALAAGAAERAAGAAWDALGMRR